MKHYGFATPDFIGKVSVTESEIQDFYAKNQRLYQIPPQYNVSYITIDPKNYLSGVNVTDKDIKEYYDSEINTFTVPEKVHVKKIVLPISPEANQQTMQAAQQFIQNAEKDLQSGVPFDKVAQRFKAVPSSSKFKDDGWLTRGEIKGQYEELVFSLTTGKPSPVFTMQDGYHIIMVDKKEASRIKTLDEVKSEIITQLKTIAATTTAEAKAEIVITDAKDNTKLNDLAAKYSFKAENTNWFSAKNVPILTDNREFLAVLATTAPGKYMGPFKAENGYYVMQLAAKQDSRIPKLEEVKDKVKGQILYNKAQEDALKASQAAQKELQAGSTIDQIASKMGSKLIQIGPFSALENVPGLGRKTQLAITAFYLPEGKTSGVITVQDPMGQGFIQYFIIRVKSKQLPPESLYMDQKETNL